MTQAEYVPRGWAGALLALALLEFPPFLLSGARLATADVLSSSVSAQQPLTYQVTHPVARATLMVTQPAALPVAPPSWLLGMSLSCLCSWGEMQCLGMHPSTHCRHCTRPCGCSSMFLPSGLVK